LRIARIAKIAKESKLKNRSSASHPAAGGFFIWGEQFPNVPIPVLPAGGVPRTTPSNEVNQVKPAKPISKEEIIAAIQKCSEELGYAPSFQELNRAVNLSQRRMAVLFGKYAEALRAAGMEARGGGIQLKMEELFADWCGVVRKTGKIPSAMEYRRHSRYSVRPLMTRFRKWGEVPRGMLEFGKTTGTAEEWEDVVNVINRYMEARKARAKTFMAQRAFTSTSSIGLIQGRPHYGNPIQAPAMAHAPTNEMGVMLLFGMLAKQLGFIVLRAQAGFPDCEAMRQMEEGRWQRVRIEFEWRSRNFFDHEHNAKHCDLIVCWEHNWPGCPIEVLELKEVLSNCEAIKDQQYHSAPGHPESPRSRDIADISRDRKNLTADDADHVDFH
jgi:hypothetical protein